MSGSFDRFVAAGRGKRGTSEVDTEFLKEIELWRNDLARNIALRNADISVDDLNAAVQLTIDRLIFLRMAEDRGMEVFEQLRRLADGQNVYRAFIKDLCRKADDKYNSGLFDLGRDRVTPGLSIDDKVLKSIISRLYFPESPYEFKVMPVEILGSVYEQFLGKVIRLTSGHSAKVEEKPEVKKAGGVYYTPSYIVDYIVKNTVGKWLDEAASRRPASAKAPIPATFRVLDMACGSGSFLLGAYKYLLTYSLDWYSDKGPERFPKAVQRDGDGWRLTTAERKRILVDHIFGVDIDRQAVEVTKLSLLLQVLEGENSETLQQLALFHERALPDLDANIKCGNSLIGPDYFTGSLVPDPDEMRRVNPFDWQHEFPAAFKDGGFDCIIGNPPYIRMEGFKDLKAYLKSHYATHDERTDLYVYFIEAAHRLMMEGGSFGMIVSNKFLRAKYGHPLRRFLTDNATVTQVTDFAGLPVFPGATVRTVVLLTAKPVDQNHSVLYSPPLPMSVFTAVAAGRVSVAEAVRDRAYSVPATALKHATWVFSRQDVALLLEKMANRWTPLVTQVNGGICRGLVSGLTDAFVIDRETAEELVHRNAAAQEIIKPFVNGRDIRRYHVESNGSFIIYTYHGVCISRYPAIKNYLEQFRERLSKRATSQAWYELQQPQRNFAPLMEGPKIIFPDIATTPRFALDTCGHYSSNTTYFIPSDDKYLLGLLNSRLGSFYFAHTCAGLEGKTETYLRFFGQYMEHFPVRIIDPSSASDRHRHDRVVSFVEQMLDLQERLYDAKSERDKDLYQRQIDATDREIDRLVYDLYGLTDDEIRIVEESH